MWKIHLPNDVPINNLFYFVEKRQELLFYFDLHYYITITIKSLWHLPHYFESKIY